MNAALLPDGIYLDHARFTGALVARCSHCRFLCAYWETRDELNHNCEEYPDDRFQ